MGKSSPSSLPPVDQGALIDAQAEANRVNTFTPLGNQFFGTVASDILRPSSSRALTIIDLADARSRAGMWRGAV